jgi:hypothetical protein
MAKKANENVNAPSEEDVEAAVANIEQHLEDLASERGAYMARCKRIRDLMDADYDTATDRGIRKKLLKRIIKKRELERKIVSQAADLEPDERSEMEMLLEKLGDFANTPLGGAAVAAAGGAETLASVGA